MNYDNHRNKIRFSVILSHADKQELGKFRYESYAVKKRYMMNELDEDGLDVYDTRGTTYAAWAENTIIGSIRLCPYPFEVNKYIDEEILKQFLGKNYQHEYLEWTRLLISPDATVPHLLHKLILYAGIHTMKTSAYKKYVGYSTPLIKRLFSRYQLTDDNVQFSIPQRGNHHYILFKGDFAQDYLNMQKQQEAC